VTATAAVPSRPAKPLYKQVFRTFENLAYFLNRLCAAVTLPVKYNVKGRGITGSPNNKCEKSIFGSDMGLALFVFAFQRKIDSHTAFNNTDRAKN
jgi:hypothetical protein